MILSQWPSDPMQLPESHWNRLMGLPAGKCGAVSLLLWFITAVAPQGFTDGQHQSCAWYIRTARMWVEVISNEFYLLYGTNAFSTLHACSLSIHTAIEHSLFLFKLFLFPFTLKGALSFFFFFEHEFRQFKLPLNDKLRVPRWKKVPCV